MTQDAWGPKGRRRGKAGPNRRRGGRSTSGVVVLAAVLAAAPHSPAAAQRNFKFHSIERNYTQRLRTETSQEFNATEVDAYRSIMEGYTTEFGASVGAPLIETACDVLRQEVASAGTGPYPTLRVNFAMEYRTGDGYNLNDYPVAFRAYVNGRLQQVAEDMRLRDLPVMEADVVTVLTTDEPKNSPTDQPTDQPRPTDAANVTPANADILTLVLVIGPTTGALIIATLIYCVRRRQRTSLQREAQKDAGRSNDDDDGRDDDGDDRRPQDHPTGGSLHHSSSTPEPTESTLHCPNALQEEDEEVPGPPPAEAFDFVFSNKTESDALCLEVSDKLTSRGVTVWQQRTNIPKDTDNWFNEWFPSAVRARKIVCFLTMEYLKSPYCMREFGIALNSSRLLVVACEPLAEINEVDPSDYPHASNALAYLINGGQVIFHDSEDVIAEILKFAGGSNDEEAGACTDLGLVDKAHLMNGGQVIFHVSKDTVAKNLGGSRLTEVFDFVFSNKTQTDALCLEIRDKLTSHGVKVWQQRTNIPKDSDNWFDEWFQSARKARKIVCFLTADYIKSPYCMKEFGIALNTNKLLAVAIDPLATINEVDPSAYPKASNALAYLINGGEVIIHDTDDVVAEILKFARNPGKANLNDEEAETQAEPFPVEDLSDGNDDISKTSGEGRRTVA